MRHGASERSKSICLYPRDNDDDDDDDDDDEIEEEGTDSELELELESVRCDSLDRDARNFNRSAEGRDSKK